MGRFIFQELTLGGMPRGEPVSVSTVTGILLQCPPAMTFQSVDHMAAMARANPNQPYDLSLWKGPEETRAMVWTARIYWSNNHG